MPERSTSASPWNVHSPRGPSRQPSQPRGGEGLHLLGGRVADGRVGRDADGRGTQMRGSGGYGRRSSSHEDAAAGARATRVVACRRTATGRLDADGDAEGVREVAVERRAGDLGEEKSRRRASPESNVTRLLPTRGPSAASTPGLHLRRARPRPRRSEREERRLARDDVGTAANATSDEQPDDERSRRGEPRRTRARTFGKGRTLRHRPASCPRQARRRVRSPRSSTSLEERHAEPLERPAARLDHQRNRVARASRRRRSR